MNPRPHYFILLIQILVVLTSILAAPFQFWAFSWEAFQAPGQLNIEAGSLTMKATLSS